MDLTDRLNVIYTLQSIGLGGMKRAETKTSLNAAAVQVFGCIICV